MCNWTAYIQLNVFGYDDYFYGDINGDGVLDRLPPNSTAPNYVDMTTPQTLSCVDIGSRPLLGPTSPVFCPDHVRRPPRSDWRLRRGV